MPKTKQKKHTPYVSEAQATAGNIALAAKKGKLPKSKLKGASRQMFEGMTLDELVSHSAEAKGKDLPKKKGGSKKKGSNPKKSEFLKFIKGRKDKTGKAKG